MLDVKRIFARKGDVILHIIGRTEPAILKCLRWRLPVIPRLSQDVEYRNEVVHVRIQPIVIVTDDKASSGNWRFRRTDVRRVLSEDIKPLGSWFADCILPRFIFIGPDLRPADSKHLVFLLGASDSHPWQDINQPR